MRRLGYIRTSITDLCYYPELNIRPDTGILTINAVYTVYSSPKKTVGAMLSYSQVRAFGIELVYCYWGRLKAKALFRIIPMWKTYK